MSASELSNLGFKPTGETYWAFSLKDAEELNVGEFDIKVLGGRESTKPFIVNLSF